MGILSAPVDAIRWAGTKVDEKVVFPVAEKLAASYVNPYVLSYFIWQKIKELTPQRARDLSRLLSTAVVNAVGVLGAEQAQGLKSTTKQLKHQVLVASASPQGRDIVVNGVATLSKVAQALNTPETKVATTQVFETLQSCIDFFASPEGRKVIETTGECLNRLCEVAASPEASIFLAEVATNICHAVEIEALRRQQEEHKGKAVSTESEPEPGQIPNDTATDPHAPPMSPTNSLDAETASLNSEVSSLAPLTGIDLVSKDKKREFRSARIEKDVLLKMGVDTSMIDEIQRVLDAIQEEQTKAQAERDAKVVNVVPDHEEQEEVEDAAWVVDEDAEISQAFGLRTADGIVEESEEENKQEARANDEQPDDDEVILPEWHEQSMRQALRKRHQRREQEVHGRDSVRRNATEIAQTLAERRHLRHRWQSQHRPQDAQSSSLALQEMTAADLIACRTISQLIIYCVGFVVMMFSFFAIRHAVGF